MYLHYHLCITVWLKACRGKNLDDGQPVADGPEDEVDIKNEIRIPLDADFLYAYSTTPGIYTWQSKSLNFILS